MGSLCVSPPPWSTGLCRARTRAGSPQRRELCTRIEVSLLAKSKAEGEKSIRSVLMRTRSVQNRQNDPLPTENTILEADRAAGGSFPEPRRPAHGAASAPRERGAADRGSVRWRRGRRSYLPPRVWRGRGAGHERPGWSSPSWGAGTAAAGRWQGAPGSVRARQGAPSGAGGLCRLAPGTSPSLQSPEHTRAGAVNPSRVYRAGTSGLAPECLSLLPQLCPLPAHC